MAIPLRKLKERCEATFKDFQHLPGAEVRSGPHGQHIFFDRGKDILAVAHTDYVMWGRPHFYKNDQDGVCIQCPQLDDRLGCWVLLDVLPILMGGEAQYDLLLTDGEESGRTTAKDFTAPRQYKWGFEFDRRGIGAVLYKYDNVPAFKDALKAADFDIQFGSFSDICALESVGRCFVNIGTGYYSEHTSACRARIRDTISQAAKFADFWELNKNIEYPWTKPVYNYQWPSHYQSDTNYVGYGRGNPYGGYYQDTSKRKTKRSKYVKPKSGKGSCVRVDMITCSVCKAMNWEDEMYNGKCWRCANARDVVRSTREVVEEDDCWITCKGCASMIHSNVIQDGYCPDCMEAFHLSGQVAADEHPKKETKKKMQMAACRICKHFVDETEMFPCQICSDCWDGLDETDKAIAINAESYEDDAKMDAVVKEGTEIVVGSISVVQEKIHPLMKVDKCITCQRRIKENESTICARCGECWSALSSFTRGALIRMYKNQLKQTDAEVAVEDATAVEVDAESDTVTVKDEPEKVQLRVFDENDPVGNSDTVKLCPDCSNVMPKWSNYCDYCGWVAPSKVDMASVKG